MHVYMYLSICLVPPQNPPFLHFCNFSCHFWLPSKYLELAINCMCRIEDWRFSEKLLQSRSGLKIEDSQKNFFNPGLDWRLKILRKTSSIQVWLHIFNPGLDWRSFSENLQSSIFNPGLDWRSFSENLQSSTQTWIEEVFLRIFNLQSDTFCN